MDFRDKRGKRAPGKSALIATLLLLLAPSLVWAKCSVKNVITAPPLYYNATTSLNLTGSASVSGRTDYNGSFNCSKKSNEVSNIATFSNKSGNTLYLKYPGDIYVSVLVTTPQPDDVELNKGTHFGSEVDASFTVNLKLLNGRPSSKNIMEVGGDIATISPLIIAQDSTGLGLIGSVLRLVADLGYFIFHWEWPSHDYDIFIKPMQIQFSKYVTTCSFDDKNKTVMLNDVDLASLSSGASDGQTPFTLNFTCDQMVNGATTRNVSAFLSSQYVMSEDNTIMLPDSLDSAIGVGIRLKRASDNMPIKISSSETTQGDATALFTKTTGQGFDSTFMLKMMASYAVYNRPQLTSGPVHTSAIVNFVYD